jgi:arylsulfatase A-like enzyme
MRYDNIAGHGNAEIHTPNLDRLLAGGVSFDGCFAQNPLCMPSRASFMTGLYPQQTGVTDNGHCLDPDFQPTVATAFKAAGYQTAQIGKLHFQPHENHDLDPRPRHPYGFDVFQVSEERGCYEDAYMTWLETQHPDLKAAWRVPRSTAPNRQDPEFAGQAIDAPWQTSHAGWIVDMARQYLGSRGRLPVMMHLGFYNPHPPLTPCAEAFAPYADAAIAPPRRQPEEWADKDGRFAGILHNQADMTDDELIHYRRYFYAMVTEMDLAIGGLLDHLDQHDMLEDTLIVFSSDHGDACGDHGITHKNATCYDEIMHLPLVMHWPAGLGAVPRRLGGLVEMVDLLPTLLELAGGVVPPTMVGRSYASALLAGEPPATREDVLAYFEDDGGALAMCRTERWKYLRDDDGVEVLYDLRDEPREVINRAGDPAAGDALAEMRSRLMNRLIDASRSRQRRLFRF